MNAELGSLAFEGKIDGNELVYVVVVEAGGRNMEITMTGTVEGEEISGRFGYHFGNEPPGASRCVADEHPLFRADRQRQPDRGE